MRFPLTCYAISAKRYALYRKTTGGLEPVHFIDAPEQSSFDEIEPDETGMVDRSESGLGVYLDPIDPEKPRRDSKGRRVWINEAWDWLLRANPKAAMPDWEGVHALTRFGVSGPKVQAWFSGFDDSVDRALRIRPGTFGLIAHPDGFTPSDPEALPLPTARFERDPKKWPDLEWYDRRSGATVDVTTATPGRGRRSFDRAMGGVGVRVRTLGDVVGTYAMRAEHKSLGPWGDPVAHDTFGQLDRRPVESARMLTDLTGKEANKLMERMAGEVVDPAEYRSDYGGRVERWDALVLPVLRRIAADEGIGGLMERSGRGRSAAYDALAGAGKGQRAYLDAAVSYAEAQLVAAGIASRAGPYPALYCYLQLTGSEPGDRLCAWCERPIPPHARADARFCSAGCRQAARRLSSSSTEEGGLNDS